jgi:hypothetical protein
VNKDFIQNQLDNNPQLQATIQQWRNDPVTKLMMRCMIEDLLRPVTPQFIDEHGTAYANGMYAGKWEARDYIETFGTGAGNAEEPEMNYGADALQSIMNEGEL